MKYVSLAEARVSRICFGTWAYGGEWGSFDREQSIAAIQKAWEQGINFYDTAQAYGFGISERILGQALADLLRQERNNLFIATKGGLRMNGNKMVRDSSPGWLRSGLEQSLRNLGVDYIDLYQVHWPDPAVPLAEVAGVMAEFVQAGLVRYVGVSNYNVAQMQEFSLGCRLNSLQPPYHLFRRGIEAEILPYARQNDIFVLVYSPLAHGLLSGKYTPETTFAPDDWRSQSPVFQGQAFRQNLKVVAQLKELADGLELSLPQLALAWVLHQPGVGTAIVGARSPEQIAGTAPAAETELSEQTLAEIDRITADAVPVGGPSPEGGIDN